MHERTVALAPALRLYSCVSRTHARAQPPAPRTTAESPSVDQLLLRVGYRVERQLADTERGMVFAAQDLAGQRVAVRVLLADRVRSAGAALEQTARSGLRLQHPHIVRSIAAGACGVHQYLVMELVDGPSLAERVRVLGPLVEREAATVLLQLAQALGYATRHGVSHARLTPSDVLLAPARPGTTEPFCAKIGNGLPLGPAPGAVAGDDRRALATVICWGLTPTPAQADADPTSTLRVGGISPDLMQVLGRMLAAQPLTWEEVVEHARRLPCLRQPAASAP